MRGLVKSSGRVRTFGKARLFEPAMSLLTSSSNQLFLYKNAESCSRALLAVLHPRCTDADLDAVDRVAKDGGVSP